MRLYWPLIGLSVVFLTPVLAAGILLSNNVPIKTAQHGMLLQPQTLELTNPQHLFGSLDTNNKWQLVYIANEPVHDDTTQILQNLHAALGPQRDRVSIWTSTPANLGFPVEHHSVLIINPKQLCIMQYPNINSYSGLLKDLRRLLKYSHV